MFQNVCVCARVSRAEDSLQNRIFISTVWVLGFGLELSGLVALSAGPSGQPVTATLKCRMLTTGERETEKSVSQSVGET